MSKAMSGPMAAHVAQRTTTLTDIVRFQALDGEVLGLTRLDKDVEYDDGDGDVTYKASEGLTISAHSTSFGVDIDNVTFVCFLKNTGFDRDEIINGKWRHAEFKTYRVNYKDLTMGDIKMRRGRVGDIKVGKALTIEGQGMLGRFRKEQVERTAPLCRAVHGDIRCKIDLASTAWPVTTALNIRLPFSAGELTGTREVIIKPSTPNDRWFETLVAGTTGGSEPSWNTTLGGSTSDGGVTHKTIRARRVNTNIVTAATLSFTVDYTGDAPDNFFDDGFFVVNSGVLTGQVFPIASWVLSTKTVTVFEPMPVLLLNTDDVDLVSGCDLTRDNCINLYDNIKNRRAESHLPGDNFRHQFKIPPASG